MSFMEVLAALAGVCGRVCAGRPGAAVGALRQRVWEGAYTRVPVGAFLRRRRGCTGRMGKDRAAVELKTYIVEDNATIRENLIGTLEELACIKALGWAETEDDAKLWLSAHTGGWDLAIVDLFLKQGSGLGVLEACRNRPTGQRLVVLSNYATPDMRKRCSQLGADAVFDKSNEIDALVDYCLQLSEGGAGA
jgi:two-component system, OmpR family, response regulator